MVERYEALRDEAILNRPPVSPLAVLMAQKVYAQGRSEKGGLRAAAGLVRSPGPIIEKPQARRTPLQAVGQSSSTKVPGLSVATFAAISAPLERIVGQSLVGKTRIASFLPMTCCWYLRF